MKKERKEGLKEQTGIDIPDWFNKLPNEVRGYMEPIIQNIIQNSETPVEANKAINQLRKVAPEYIFYHYQNLHPVLNRAVLSYYTDGDYYNAVVQGTIKYIRRIQTKSSSALTESDTTVRDGGLMSRAPSNGVDLLHHLVLIVNLFY